MLTCNHTLSLLKVFSLDTQITSAPVGKLSIHRVFLITRWTKETQSKCKQSRPSPT